MADRRDPPLLLLRWESLRWPAQFALAFPVAVALLFLVHVTALNQPLLRGLSYALFWGVIATGIVVAASRNEAARRRGELPPDAF